MLKPKVAFEDDDILVINKPSGLVVNRAETVKGETLQDWVEKNYQITKLPGSYRMKLRSNCQIEKNEFFYQRSGIVHRLDKDTSGLMIVAKTPESFFALQRQFKERRVEKKYLALVHGRLEPKEGDIKLPLARKPKDRKKFAIRLGGKEGLTKYKRLVIYKAMAVCLPERTFSLVELEPKTGRTHQLRVHLKHIGNPVVSDSIYLGEKRLRQDLKWCPRLFLHAKFLGFTHPENLKHIEFESGLPVDLKNVISKIAVFESVE